jgi:hypothetical protein
VGEIKKEAYRIMSDKSFRLPLVRPRIALEDNTEYWAFKK